MDMNIAILWKTNGHKQRFVAAMKEIGKIYNNNLGTNIIDPEYGAAIYILSEDEHLWGMAKPYVSSRGIEFEKMIQEIDLTHGTYVLVHLAANLFNTGVARSNPGDIAGGTLDESNYLLAISAFHVRRFGLGKDDLK